MLQVTVPPLSHCCHTLTFIHQIALSFIPGAVRLSCDSLTDLIDVRQEDVCTSSLFLGNGALAKAMSVVLVLHTSYAMVPLTMFFVVTFLGNMRHFKASRVYGLLVRADVKSPPRDVCPVLDLRIANNIRAWVRSRVGLHFFGILFSIQCLLKVK